MSRLSVQRRRNDLAMSAREQIKELEERMGRAIVGQEPIIERLILGLLANGNLLVEGLPGLAKTRAVKSLAKNLEADLSRIQFTPDLLPSDVTGTEMYYQESGKGEFLGCRWRSWRLSSSGFCGARSKHRSGSDYVR